MDWYRLPKAKKVSFLSGHRLETTLYSAFACVRRNITVGASHHVFELEIIGELRGDLIRKVV